MKYERIIWIVAVLVVGAASFTIGRQQGIVVGQTTVQQTANDFFAQRGGGAPGQGLPGAPSAGGIQRGTGQGGGGQSANGEVVSVAGDVITVKNQRDGTTLTVQVSTETQIRKQATGAISDIKVGDTIMATGARDGDTITAQTIQLGGFGGRGAGPSPTTGTP